LFLTFFPRRTTIAISGSSHNNPQNERAILDWLRDLIAGAGYLVVGAGAGLSASGGMSYHDHAVFQRFFPELQGKGFSTVWEAVTQYWAVSDASRLSYWAYWALHIHKIRYQAPACPVYLDLFSLLKEKRYFIYTTNVDGQFAKAGFDSAHLFNPQGDYGLFQCRRPCTQELYSNREMIEKMLAGLDYTTFRIQPEDVPRCPRCGDYLERNLRIDDTFAEAQHMVAQKAWRDFVSLSMADSLVLLELGVGFNTPGVIRWPFEDIAAAHPRATLVRINRDEPEVPRELFDKAGGLKWDIAQTIRALVE